jgi:homoaconitase/3-isopropylmalate dehydratase large subunit
MAQLIDLEAGIDCTSPNGKDGKQKLKFFWDLKKPEKFVFLFDHTAPKKNIQNFAMNHITKVQLESPLARETITMFFRRLDSTVNLYKMNKIIQICSPSFG